MSSNSYSYPQAADPISRSHSYSYPQVADPVSRSRRSLRYKKELSPMQRRISNALPPLNVVGNPSEETKRQLERDYKRIDKDADLKAEVMDDILRTVST